MSSNLTKGVENLDIKFYALSLRERTLVVVAGLAFVLLLGFVSFIEPVLKNADRNSSQLQSKENALREMDQQIAELEQELRADPNIPLRQRLESIEKQIALLDASLDSYTEDLIPADKMPELLDKVLSRSDKLKLVSMESIAPIQLLSADDKSEQSVDINLYQHGVRLVLEGTYFDIQAYLEQLEGLKWHFYWKVFTYDVLEHPTAKVELELYTLSTSAAFIGVGRNE